MTGIGGGPSPALPAAVLLDRDGVLVEPVADPRLGTFESPLHPDEVELVAGAAEATSRLAALGVLLVVVSNQPAAAKGTVGLDELLAVHDRTVELLARAGVALDGWEYCFHHPNGIDHKLSRECDCRKPRPGLLRRVLDARALAAEECWMVGDADTDVIAGSAVGARTALLAHPLTGHRRVGEGGWRGDRATADVHAEGLLDFVDRIGLDGASGSISS